MFGWVRVKGLAVTDAIGTKGLPVVFGGGGIQTTKERGGEVKDMIEGAGLRAVAAASMIRS
jgi:hypothetical protein